MRKRKFVVGDVVRGLKGNRYSITNDEMLEGEVTLINSDTLMTVEVIKHKIYLHEGDSYEVENSPEEFELIRTTTEAELKFLIDSLIVIRDDVSATEIDPPTQAMARNHIDGAIGVLRRLQK